MLKGFIQEKEVKNMNSKMTANSQLLTTIPKTKTSKLSKQLEWKQNNRNGDHMEGYQQGNGRGRVGERYRE